MEDKWIALKLAEGDRQTAWFRLDAISGIAPAGLGSRLWVHGTPVLVIQPTTADVEPNPHATQADPVQNTDCASHSSPAGPGVATYDSDILAGDRERAASVPHAHRRGAREVEPAGRRAHENGVSTARRSGTREPGSTSSTRRAASGPAATRAWRTASRSRARRTAIESSSSEG